MSVTVIIPFFDEVPFLKNALNSVISQPINDIEVIIINDNPDIFDDNWFTLTIGAHENVRIIHQKKNRGLSASRNVGIKHARGKFLAFLDADDYFMPMGLAWLWRSAKFTQADMTHGNTMITAVNRPYGVIAGREREALAGPAVLEGREIVDRGYYILSSWSCLYRTDFLRSNSLYFDNSLPKFEDRLFLIESLLKAHRLVTIAKPVRVWRRRPGSITTRPKTNEDAMLKLDMIEKVIGRWQTAIDNGEATATVINREWVRQVVTVMVEPEIFGPVLNRSARSTGTHSILMKRLSSLMEACKPNLAFVLPELSRLSETLSEHTMISYVSPYEFSSYVNSVAKGDFETAWDISQKVCRQQRSETPSVPSLRLSGYNDKLKNKLEFILHIGLHKTGSTFIQTSLDQNRKNLIKSNVLFPRSGLGTYSASGPTRKGGSPGHHAIMQSVIKGEMSLIDKLHEEIAHSGCSRVILSVENMSLIFLESCQREKIYRQFVEAVFGNSKVQVVACVRRPDAWIDSLYREQVCNAFEIGYQSASEFLSNNNAILNFSDLFTSVEAAVGEPIRIFGFEASVSGKGLISSFADITGFGDFSKSMSPSLLGERYRSPCDAQMAVARLIAATHATRADRRIALQSFFQLSKPTEQRNSLLTRQERIQCVQTCLDMSGEFLKSRHLDLDENDWLKQAEKELVTKPTVIPVDFLEFVTQQLIWSSKPRRLI